MIGIVATLSIKPEHADEFVAMFLELTAKVREEAGCLLYQLCRKREAEGVFVVMELYADQAAVDLHMGTEYFKAFSKQVGSLVAGRPVIEQFDAVTG
jgi:quinol monooxygenase YgiN